MNQLAKISFESPYRQLDQAGRAFVDNFVSQIERTAEHSGRAMFDVLSDYAPATERELQHLARSLVRAAIFDRVKELTEAQNISARRIVKELTYIAFSSIDHFRRPESSLNDNFGAFELEYATPEQRAAVKEVESEESARTGKTKIKIKLHDKLAALRMLGQIQGLFGADGEPINPEKWAEAEGILSDKTAQDAQDSYMRLINGD